MKCEQCGRRFHTDFPEFVWNDWLKLSFFLEFLRTEDQITNETYESMSNALMGFKPRLDEEGDA